MKLSFILLIVTFFQANAMTFAQKVSMKVAKVPLKTVFYELSKQTGYNFVADANLSKKISVVSVNLQDVGLKEAIEKCFDGIAVDVVLNEEHKTVFIKEKPIAKTVTESRRAVSREVQQQIAVRGTVTDEDGKPLPAVSIAVKGTQTRAVTDVKGNFEMNVLNEESSLIFTYIGYQSQERLIGKSRTLNIKLLKSVSELDEVIVNIGYGEVKREDLTGSVGEVKVEELQKAPVATFDQALAGRVAGVQVSSNQGQPGENAEIVIRGGNSLTQSNAPLYVIDGFPMEEFSISSLNPEDIASVSILKDASATAIYGSRGANGVIIVDTKQGKLGLPEVVYHGYAGIQKPVKRMKMMDPYEFVKYQYEMAPESTEKLYFQKPSMTLEDYRNSETIDWQSLLFQESLMHNHNLSVRGATNYTKYSFSGSFVEQDGIIINSGFNRVQGRAIVEQTITDKLKANININYSQDKNYGSLASEMKSSSNSYASYLMYRILGYRPVANDIDIINELIDPEDESALFLMNPLISTRNEIRQEKKSDIFISSALNYNITKDLVLNVRGGYTQRFTKREALNNSQTYRGFTSNWNPNGANGTYGDIELNIWVNENRLTYKKRLNKDHYFDVTTAFTMQGVDMSTYGFEVDRITQEELGIRSLDYGIPKSVTSVINKNKLMSYLGRANYNLKSKYLFTASVRADGSSKFARSNRWGVFPSGAFAWQMGKENFLKSVKWINDAKLRVSYGITGNNRIGDFSRFQTLTMGDYYSFANQEPIYAAVVNSMGNQTLKWESTEQIDIGYDMSLFKNRVNLTVDIYQKNTSDLLLNANIPLSTGFNAVYKNIGKVRNRGLELTLNTVNIRKKDFSWESSFNISFNQNKISALSEGQSHILSWVPFTGDYNGSFSYIAQVGQPAAAIYGYVWDGNYQYEDFDLIGGSYVLKTGVPNNGNTTVVPGDIKYVDFNGDGTVTEKDMVIIGRALPLHYGGFNNNFTYRGFSLNVFFQWNYGNNIMNANRLAFEGNMGNRINLNQFASYENRWTPENPTNENYRVGGFGPKGRYSSKIIEDGSFLRLKTVQLSYTFPKKWRGKLKSLEVYGAAQNLVTWSNYSGYDPEVSVRHTTLTPGFDYSSYPRNLTITAGLKTNF